MEYGYFKRKNSISHSPQQDRSQNRIIFFLWTPSAIPRANTNQDHPLCATHHRPSTNPMLLVVNNNIPHIKQISGHIFANNRHRGLSFLPRPLDDINTKLTLFHTQLLYFPHAPCINDWIITIHHVVFTKSRCFMLKFKLLSQKECHSTAFIFISISNNISLPRPYV